MAKKIFVFLTFVVIIVLVAMVMTKPEPMEHHMAVRNMAVNVAGQELSDMQLPEKYAEMGADMAMSAAGSFLQSSMQVDDYFILSVGMVNFHGQTFPVTVGAFGKVFVLADEDEMRHVIR